jgi:alpha-glucosidase
VDEFLWWRDGVIYQIYPRSFADGNGDGLGDLPGIISRLDYLANLGVDAIWLSPFYPSPDVDFGYDVSDHTSVDPRFGTLADLDRLVEEAHRRGIRLILDLVLNHTSDRHPWFLESRSRRGNPKRDWYIWRDPRPDGRPPNNWQSIVGGRDWEYDETSRQYYLHMFLAGQPDVNWHNPEVRKAQLDVVRFWLERDVDGFRLDVFNIYFKDAGLRNNPFRPGLRAFDRQVHLYDRDRPEMKSLLGKLRAILEAYPQRYAVGETYLDAPNCAAEYVGEQGLHAAFSFDFTASDIIYPWNAAWLRKQILHRERLFTGPRWPTTVLSNHDIPRAAGRYCRGEDDHQAKLAMALLLTLRGTPFLYYGEEIGMRDISLRRNEILDPIGKHYWPLYKGRDGCRSPMQWNADRYAGFSTTRPWLPVHPDYPRRNTAAQLADPGSLLNFTRKLISLRRQNPALVRGDFTLLPAPRSCLVYLRRTEDQTLLVALNFSGRRVRWSHAVPAGKRNWTTLFPADARKVDITDLVLEPRAASVFIQNQ